MQFRGQLDSTRFFYIQEGLIIGVAGAIAKTIWPGFPVLELYGFIAPLIVGAYGLKTWENNATTARKKIECPEVEESKDATSILD